MLMRIQELYTSFKKKIWFYPLFYGTFSFFMAVIILLGDSAVGKSK
jgi:hypothetical protein